MSFTFTPVGKKELLGTRKTVTGDLVISSYTLGGESILFGDVGLKRIESCRIYGAGSGTVLMNWDATNSKMLAYRVAGRGQITDIHPDIPGGITANASSDQAATHVNGAAVMALATAVTTTSGNLAHTSGKSTGITNPTHPRAVTVVVKAATGDASPVVFTAANIVVTGTDQFGAAATDTIAIQTGSVADTKFRWTVGTKVFKTITNVRLTVAQPTGAQISIGLSDVIGLTRKIAATTDVKLVQKNTAAVSSATYTASATTHSIKMGADLADTDELYFEYDAGSTEVDSATDCGTVRVEFVGK